MFNLFHSLIFVFIKIVNFEKKQHCFLSFFKNNLYDNSDYHMRYISVFEPLNGSKLLCRDKGLRVPRKTQIFHGIFPDTLRKSNTYFFLFLN